MNYAEQFKQRIEKHLDSMKSNSPEFAEKMNNPAKSLEECLDYILTTVKASRRCFFEDDEVFGMANHYYDEENPGNISKGLYKSYFHIKDITSEPETCEKAPKTTADAPKTSKAVEVPTKKKEEPKKENKQLSLF